jgi:hypothetical protein
MYMDMDMHGATARISWNSSICNPIIRNQRYPGVGTSQPSLHTKENTLLGKQLLSTVRCPSHFGKRVCDFCQLGLVSCGGTAAVGFRGLLGKQSK